MTLVDPALAMDQREPRQVLRGRADQAGDPIGSGSLGSRSLLATSGGGPHDSSPARRSLIICAHSDAARARQSQRGGEIEPVFLDGAAELGALMRAHDWTKTPLGPPSGWPRALKKRSAHHADFAPAVLARLGARAHLPLQRSVQVDHRRAAPNASPSLPARSREIWHQIGPMVDTVMQRDQGTYVEAQPSSWSAMAREETYYTSYSPVPDDGVPPG